MNDTEPSPVSGSPVRYPDLADRVAIITGGSRGIGAATALALAANAVGVAVVGRDRAAIDATVAAITDNAGRAIGVEADCTRDDDLGALHGTVADQLGPPDVLAAFAGGAGAPVPTATETPAHWRAVIDGDLTATFLTVSAFLPGMIARKSGTILTMSSAAAPRGLASPAAPGTSHPVGGEQQAAARRNRKGKAESNPRAQGNTEAPSRGSWHPAR